MEERWRAKKAAAPDLAGDPRLHLSDGAALCAHGQIEDPGQRVTQSDKLVQEQREEGSCSRGVKQELVMF